MEYAEQTLAIEAAADAAGVLKRDEEHVEHVQQARRHAHMARHQHHG